MKPRLHLLLTAAFTFFAWAAFAGFQATTQRTFAQPPSGSSRSDSGSHDHERGKFGDRGSRNWRTSSSHRDDEHRSGEKRSDEKSAGSGSSSSNSGSLSGSSNSGSLSGSSRSTGSSSSAPSTSTSTSTTSSSSTAASNLSLKSYATRLVTEHDKNGNMILEPDEQGFLGRSAAEIDLDHDGKITIDEIVMHHSGAKASSAPASGTSTTTSTASTGDSGRSGDHDRDHHRDGGFGRHDGGSGSDSRSKTDDPMAKRVLTGTAGGTGKDGDKRHSYRFSKASDKLPTGLPSWFTSRDANKDGQVSMSEYSRSVTESMVAEFRRLDTNDDGLITAKEAAKQK